MKAVITKISLCLFFSGLLMSCAVDPSKKIKGNRNVITQEREVNEPFNHVSVSQGIKLFIKMDAQETLHVEADENLHEHIITEINKGHLKIYIDGVITSSKAKTVYVSLPNLNSVKASSGSSAQSENLLMSDDLHVKSSSGASIKLDVDAINLSADSSSGSTIYLQGKATNYSSESSSGSSIRSYDLIAKNATSKVSSGARIELTATENLTPRASSGGSIKYKGKPYIDNFKTSSGGSVSRR